MYYILDDAGNPVAVRDILEWGRWYETADRTVCKTEVRPGVRVSTIYLGLDHGFGGRPLLYETMVFGLPDGSPLEDYQERYATRAEAVAGHWRAVELVKKEG
jgi:hypothetical protein